MKFMTGQKLFFGLLFLSAFAGAHAQKSYKDSLQEYIRNYEKNHEVVKGGDKKFFRFFPVDEQYRVIAEFQKATASKWLQLETSGRERKTFRVYGTLSFMIHDTLLKLDVYQAQNLVTDPKYRDYLALMFTDKTTGHETYEAGRYIDLTTGDIKDSRIVIDFNKAYNPYCAYVKNKYNCPIPPRENDLPIAINAGEKNFAKQAD